MHKEHVTIKDIAKVLGISPSTVSRALKDHPDINPDTKKAVNDLAKELHYTPDPIALSLKNRQSKIIGVIVPEIVHYFFSLIIHGIEDLAYNSGYNVMMCESNETFEREVKNVETLLSSRVDGILVSISKETKSSAHFSKIKHAGVPVVFFDRICKDIDSDRVIVNDEKGAFDAVEHLILSGRKRIFHLTAPEHLIIAMKRKDGYIKALQKYHLPVLEERIVKCDTLEEVQKVIPGLLNQNPAPDAFFAVNDITAAATFKIIKDHGLKVPDDISVVGFTNGRISDLTDPQLSSVEQQGYEMGKEAVRLLLDRIHKGPDYPSVTSVIETKLIIKGSSAGSYASMPNNY